MQGRFEILSLAGSYLLSESAGMSSRTGGLSVSLAGPDGRVLGGAVAGPLIATSPVQVPLFFFSFLNSLSQLRFLHQIPWFLFVLRIMCFGPHYAILLLQVIFDVTIYMYTYYRL